MGHTAGSIYFANQTTGQHFSITLAPPPGATFSGNSVEWIMEAPDGGEPRLSLPRFTPVHFTSAIPCGTPNVNPQNANTVNIQSASGHILTAVSLASYAVNVTFAG